MRLRHILPAIVMLVSNTLYGQRTIDTLLTGISANNKTIRSEMERVSASHVQYKIGNTLPDPVVEYDLLKGFPATAGNQNELSVTQSLDFPSVYKNKKDLTQARTTQVNYEQLMVRQKVLLDAKVTAIHIIYLNKYIRELQVRYAATEQFYKDYQKKYEKQDATILDLQKAKLQLVNLQTDLKLAGTERQEYLQKLAEANGGKPVVLPDTLYPAAPPLPSFDALHDAIDSVSPELKYFEAQVQTGQTEIDLTKSQLLPKLEFGYHYQGILGQRFHGAHIGFSIPLWENRNKLPYQKLQSRYYTAQLEEHHISHYNEIRQLYDKALSLDSTLQEYRQSLFQLNNEDLLKKSLTAGHMTALQYYLELSLLYESRNKYLDLEREYNKTLAMLYRHLL